MHKWANLESTFWICALTLHLQMTENANIGVFSHSSLVYLPQPFCMSCIQQQMRLFFIWLVHKLSWVGFSPSVVISPSRSILAPIHTDFHPQAPIHSSASALSHHKGRRDHVVIYFIWRIFHVFRLSQHPLSYLEAALMLNTNTFTASGVVNVISLRETKRSNFMIFFECGYV